MDETEALFQSADLGDRAETFIESDLGQAVLKLAADEVDAAVQELKRVSANDTERIRELQSHIWRAESFAGWLTSIVEQGREALRLLTDGEAR